MSRGSREKVHCQARAMRYIATSALLFGLIQSNANTGLLAGATASVANASTQAAIGVVRERSARASFEPRIVQNTEPETNSVTAEPDHTQSSASTNAFESICQTLQSVAHLNDLPLEFLTLDLAGEPVRRPRDKPGRRPRHSAVYARNSCLDRSD